MNYKVAIIYASVTGNTKELVEILARCFNIYSVLPEIFASEEFPTEMLGTFDAVIVATYTWGNGNVPREMHKMYEAFERQGHKTLITGVVGTGDSFYPHFCGAVDRFRDMLFVHTSLVATLKVELSPQPNDVARCMKFAEVVTNRLLVVKGKSKEMFSFSTNK